MALKVNNSVCVPCCRSGLITEYPRGFQSVFKYSEENYDEDSDLDDAAEAAADSEEEFLTHQPLHGLNLYGEEEGQEAPVEWADVSGRHRVMILAWRLIVHCAWLAPHDACLKFAF